MANRFSVINGDLYNGGVTAEMKVRDEGSHW